MKKVLLLSFSCLLLSACNSGVDRSYRLEFDLPEEEKQTVLTSAAVNIVKRRAARFQEDIPNVSIGNDDAGTTITATYSEEDVAMQVSDELTAPFIVDFMVQAAEGEPFDATVEGHGNFRKTELTGEDINVVAPEADPLDATKGRIIIEFTDAGVPDLKTVFTENRGKFIGLFVRGQLAAKIMVEATVPDKAVTISGLPTAELANVFAEDVNVGLHVTFVPIE